MEGWFHGDSPVLLLTDGILSNVGTLQGHSEMGKYITIKWLLWASARATVKKGIDFMQRQKNTDLQFHFGPSETCGGDIEKREVEGLSLWAVPS